MIDIDSVVETNRRICDDIAMERVVMGLTGEYVFAYSEKTGDIKIVRYEGISREVITRMPIDAMYGGSSQSSMSGMKNLYQVPLLYEVNQPYHS